MRGATPRYGVARKGTLYSLIRKTGHASFIDSEPRKHTSHCSWCSGFHKLRDPTFFRAGRHSAGCRGYWFSGWLHWSSARINSSGANLGQEVVRIERRKIVAFSHIGSIGLETTEPNHQGGCGLLRSAGRMDPLGIGLGDCRQDIRSLTLALTHLIRPKGANEMDSNAALRGSLVHNILAVHPCACYKRNSTIWR